MGSKRQVDLDGGTSEESSERPTGVWLSRQVLSLSVPLSKDEFNKLEFELSELSTFNV